MYIFVFNLHIYNTRCGCLSSRAALQRPARRAGVTYNFILVLTYLSIYQLVNHFTDNIVVQWAHVTLWVGCGFMPTRGNILFELLSFLRST